jgi:DNA polymerase
MLAIVGEAYGEKEEAEGRPFVGPTGFHLDNMLSNAGIKRSECWVTNVFNRRPRANQISAFCGPRESSVRGYPALTSGKYVKGELQGELDRLRKEIRKFQPYLILALGNTACWAFLGRTAIGRMRGITTISTHLVPGIKVLPTYHPAAIFKQWSLRPIVQMDIIKAAREMAFPEIRRPKREIWIQPTLEDIREFKRRYLDDAQRIAVDIETSGRQITCIGFAPRRDLALVVPFFDSRRDGRNYWPTLSIEREVWEVVASIVEDRGTQKIFQNGLYDIAFLLRSYGIRVYNAVEDTMLLHHALQPESLKSLEFLGSVYTDEGAWKQMRGKTTIKGDD